MTALSGGRCTLGRYTIPFRPRRGLRRLAVRKFLPMTHSGHRGSVTCSSHSPLSGTPGSSAMPILRPSRCLETRAGSAIILRPTRTGTAGTAASRSATVARSGGGRGWSPRRTSTPRGERIPSECASPATGLVTPSAFRCCKAGTMMPWSFMGRYGVNCCNWLSSRHFVHRQRYTHKRISPFFTLGQRESSHSLCRHSSRGHVSSFLSTTA